MKIAGIILIVLEVLALVGGIANGSIPDMVNKGEFISLIGFFIPAIIGIILLIKAKNKK